MFAQLLMPAYLPFTVSFVVMLGIGMIEAIGLGFGHLHLDADLDADAHTGLLDWLGLGSEMPILIWLTSLLGCFTIAGVAIQQIVTAASGAPLSLGQACGAALVAGAIANTLVANGLARVLPGFETTAITTDELLRARGTVLEGTARRGAPARAKVVDRHGQAHFVMVEPHNDADVLPAGTTALLVRRQGQLFFALPENDRLLQSI